MTSPSTAPSSDLQALVPKFVTVLRDGYSGHAFCADGFAALVGGGALIPVVLALTVDAGISPVRGMVSAGVAMCIVALLGGSSFQKSAPTVLLTIATGPLLAAHGGSGLAVATLMAGVLLMLAAGARWQTWIRYVPASLMTGIEIGVVVVLVLHQFGNVLGLHVFWPFAVPHNAGRATAGFIPESHAAPIGVLVGSFLLLAAIRRVAPRSPAALLSIAGATLATWLLHLPVETIGDRFAGNIIEVGVRWPVLAPGDRDSLLPTAFALAFLIGVQSLRSARVADTHSGRWHRARSELLAEGVANVVVATIGGLPVSGDPSRALENVKAGAQSPFSAIFVGLLILAAAVLTPSWANYVPIATLSAVLLMVAWDLGQWSRIRRQIGASRSDHTLAAIVALLVVFVGVGAAVGSGVLLAALLAAHRGWRERTVVRSAIDDTAGDAATVRRALSDGVAIGIPSGVEVFQVRGSLVFETAHQLSRIAPYLERRLRVLILDVQRVVHVDATGTEAMEDLVHRCHRQRTALILAHVEPTVRIHLSEAGLIQGNRLIVAQDLPHAVRIAEALTGDTSTVAGVSGDRG